MLRPILMITLLAITPLAIYSASTWPDKAKIDAETHEERERFLGRLAEQQALRCEEHRRESAGDGCPRPIRFQ